MRRLRLARPGWLEPMVVLFCALAPWAAAPGDDPREPRADIVPLEERLVTGLRARRPEDVAFLERVASLVEEGRLPEKVVNSTLAWAQRRGRNYPLPSFRRALELQADHLGVSLGE